MSELTGQMAVEKAKAAGFICEYVNGRPLFYVENDARRREAHQWAKANYGKTYAVYGMSKNMAKAAEDSSARDAETNTPVNDPEEGSIFEFADAESE